MDPEFAPAVHAIALGDLQALRSLLREDPALARRRSSCSHPTLLQMVACEAASLPDALGAAAALVDAGADLAEPLVAAASVDARDVLWFLMDQGIGVDGERDWMPLDEAVYWSHHALARELLARGASVTTLRLAAGLGRLDLVDGFFVDGVLSPGAGPIRSPFPDTVPAERADDPQDLLDNAFVMAVQGGHRDVAEALLARGARVNARPPGFHWRGTALHAAIWQGDLALAQWLVSVGADPALRDGFVHADALGWATHHGQEAIASWLRAWRS